MRRFISVLVIATLALVAASAASGGQQQEQVIRVLAVGEQFQPISGFTENQPPQVGASFAFSGSFYEWAGQKRGKRVGHFEVLVTVTSDRWGYLTATGTLPGGLIVIAGRTPLFEVPIERYAVIGGTGRYAGARGTMTVKNLRTTDNSALTFRLLP